MATIKNQETDLRTIQSINIENSEKVSTTTKKELEKTENTNNENVSEAKPKLIIKIPKPFGLGYIIIDLSKLLGKLVAGLAAAVTSILLAMIANALSDLLQDKLNSGNVSQSDIDSALNGMNMNDMINKAQSEYNKQQKINLNSSLEVNTGDGTVTDTYSKGNTNRKNISNKKKYTIDKRNRKDVLDSEIVKERDGSNNRSLKLNKNPNYGVYLD